MVHEDPDAPTPAGLEQLNDNGPTNAIVCDVEGSLPEFAATCIVHVVSAVVSATVNVLPESAPLVQEPEVFETVYASPLG